LGGNTVSVERASLMEIKVPQRGKGGEELKKEGVKGPSS